MTVKSERARAALNGLAQLLATFAVEDFLKEQEQSARIKHTPKTRPASQQRGHYESRGVCKIQ